jgi:hypothetical protein
MSARLSGGVPAALLVAWAACARSEPALRTEPDLLLDTRGTHVAPAGDVNGDGHGDLLVAAFDFTGDFNAQGRVQLFVGSPAGLVPAPAWERWGEEAGSTLGVGAAGVGDVDGDGYDEIAMSEAWSHGFHAGRLLVFRGGPLGPGASPDWIFDGPAGEQAYFGEGVVGSDVDGDGDSDVVVGCRSCNGTLLRDVGRLFVIRGGPAGLESVPTLVAEGSAIDEGFGARIYRAGDVDADGREDVLVSDRAFNHLGTPQGTVKLFRGSAGGLETAVAWEMRGGQRFGLGVVGDVDFDGDGRLDVAILAPDVTDPGGSAGQVTVHRGTGVLPETAPTWTIGPRPDVRLLGAGLAAADLDGDGYDDLLVGDIHHDDVPRPVRPDLGRGRTLVFAGGPSGPDPEPALAFRLAHPRSVVQPWAPVDGNGDGVAEIPLTRGSRFADATLWSLPSVLLACSAGPPVRTGSRTAWIELAGVAGATLSGLAFEWTSDDPSVSFEPASGTAGWSADFQSLPPVRVTLDGEPCGRVATARLHVEGRAGAADAATTVAFDDVAPPSFERPGAWSSLPALPEGRWGAALIATASSELLVAGGHDDDLELLRLSPSAGAWTRVSRARPGTVAPAVVLGGVMTVAGGRFHRGGCGPRVRRLLDDASGFDIAPTSFEVGRCGHGAAVPFDALVVVAGGTEWSDDPAPPLATVEWMDPAAETQGRLAPMRRARTRLSLVAAGPGLVAIGGEDASGGLTDTVEAWDASTDAWRTVAPLPEARADAASAVLAGRVHVLGGLGPAGATSTHFVYDPTSDTWARLADLSQPRSLAAAVVLDGRIVLVGGSDAAGDAMTAVEAWEPSVLPPPAERDAPCSAVPAPLLPAPEAHDAVSEPTVEIEELRVDGACADSYDLVRTWVATDACGNAARAPSETVHVTDLVAPQLTGVPAGERAACDAIPRIAAPDATDDCDPAPAIAFVETIEPGRCPGEHRRVRTWTARDRCGNEAAASQVIDVFDHDPPTIAPSRTVIAELWPPDHRIVRVPSSLLAPAVADACSDPVTWRLFDCFSGQDDDGRGDGSTSGDCTIEPGGGAVLARAERTGREPGGRSYSVRIVATDACGNESLPRVVGVISVSHDRR